MLDTDENSRSALDEVWLQLPDTDEPRPVEAAEYPLVYVLL